MKLNKLLIAIFSLAVLSLTILTLASNCISFDNITQLFSKIISYVQSNQQKRFINKPLNESQDVDWLNQLYIQHQSESVQKINYSQALPKLENNLQVQKLKQKYRKLQKQKQALQIELENLKISNKYEIKRNKQFQQKKLEQINRNLQLIKQESIKYAQLQNKYKLLREKAKEIQRKYTRIQQFTSILLNFKINNTVPIIRISSSTILNDRSNLIKLINFYSKLPFKIELKFKASEHNFSLESFYQACGDLSSLVFLFKTDKNIILGGFSPFEFNSYFQNSQEIQPLYDPLGSSFIFSLPQNKRFNIKQGEPAIIRSKSKQSINFGRSLIINSDNTGQLWIEQGSYNIEGYSSESLTSWLKLTGYENVNEGELFSFGGEQGNKNKFTLKQWEVFQLQFQ